MDYSAVLDRAKNYEQPMVQFLRDIIAIQSLSGKEDKVIARIRKEVEKLGAADKIWTDGLGSLLVKVGNGPRLIAIDAHIDTVDVGNAGEWKHDPFKGKVEGGLVWGRGAGDQKGAVPAMVYATKIIKDLGLKSDEWSLLLSFTVMEEDCDGLCWQYIVQEEKIRPECVVITDSTNCKVLRGQRGRMEIGITVLGKSCHGSMPEKGDNAVYKAAKIVGEVEKLHKRLKKNKFLGNGTVTVSYIDCQTPSRCAVPGAAFIQLDRRLTVGETKEQALKEVRKAVKRAGVEAKVELLKYAEKAYTGLTYPDRQILPQLVRRRRCPTSARRGRRAQGTVRQAANRRSLDLQHQRRVDRRHVRHSVRRLRAGRGRCRPHGERQRADRASGPLRSRVCRLPGNLRWSASKRQ